MKTNHLTVSMAVLLWALLGLPSNSALGSDIEIVGSAKFTNQIVKALAILKRKAPDAYGIITNNIKRLQQGEKSGMWAYKTPPTYEIADKTTFYSVTWCSATIAHDSFHSKLYHEYKLTHGTPVPDSIWTGTDAEKQCMKHQLAVMARIGSPDHEIAYAVRESDGHYVDDKESWDKYKKKRNW
jgi:hypothetical protein